ncbi:MAG: hypothetical protein AAF333_14015 [Planctomycetota bacterium]
MDPEAEYVFGRNLPRMLDLLDESARSLGVTEPSRFIWHNPMDDEGKLDQISEAEFEALERKHEATKFWVPLDEGIQTFRSLGSRHELSPEFGTPNDQEYYIAFEVACFREALLEADAAGETGFHIQCY